MKTFPVVDLKGRSRRKLQIFIETRSDAFDPRFPFSSRSDCSSLVYEKVNSLSNAIKLIVIYESSLVKVVGKEISLKECLFCSKLWRPPPTTSGVPANTNPLKSAGALYNFGLILRFNSENLSRWKYTECSFDIAEALKSSQKTLRPFGMVWTFLNNWEIYGLWTVDTVSPVHAGTFIGIPTSGLKSGTFWPERSFRCLYLR